MHNQLFTLKVVRGPNLDLAAQCELERVLGQVDQDLLQAYLVPHELVRQADVLLRGVQQLVELALRIAKNWHGFETELRVLHVNLLLKHARYEAEDLPRLEQFFFGDELVFLDQFQIQNVIHQAEK